MSRIKGTQETVNSRKLREEIKSWEDIREGKLERSQSRVKKKSRTRL